MELNAEQLQAVNSSSDRILCLAPAGSGKTKTMLGRISRLVYDGVPASSILVLTFTNAAAAEMKERYERLHLGGETPEFRTFHAFCYALLCKDSAIRAALGYTSVPTIASEEQEKSIAERARTQCNIKLSKEKLESRENLNKQEQFQVELYDKAVNRLMHLEDIITFDKLSTTIADLFASGHFATESYKKNYNHILVDECLPADMCVLTDNGWYHIDRLYEDFVSKRDLPLVKSYNVETSEYEYKPILGALKSENRDIYEVHTEGLNKIRCTANHMLYTQRGYVAVEDLVVGQDMVILDTPDKQKTKYLLNPDQYQICLGSYLGDGCVERMSKFFTYRLNITQGYKQQDYFMSKISAFNLNYRTVKSGYTGESSILASNYTPIFALNDDIFNDVISDISPLGLAIWYQDDGTLNRGYYPVISTGSFSIEQTSQLVTMLKTRFDIEAIAKTDTRGYCYIRFNATNGNKFLSLISPYMHPSMQYKTTINISDNVISYDSHYLNIGANFIDSITYVGCATVYDITVADNHNFITSASAHRVDSKTGTIVHNCQDTDATQMKFLDAFAQSNFYLTGDTLQNIYGFRGTSNAYIKALANAPDWEKIMLHTNYRSTRQICEYANKFSKKYADPSYWIEMQGTRDGDKVITKLVDGPKGYTAIDSNDIADVLKENSKLSGTSAILCRTNKEVAAVTSYLKRESVPFTTSNDTKLPKLLECALSAKYMMEYLASYLSSDKYGEYIRISTLVDNPDLSWFLANYGNNSQIKEDVRQINFLKDVANGVGTTEDKITEVSKFFHIKNIKNPDKPCYGVEFLKYLLDAVIEVKETELYVGTIHSVKGLEYDNVFVMNVGSYSFRLRNEEMKNLFYVAITRAKSRLFVYELFE